MEQYFAQLPELSIISLQRARVRFVGAMSNANTSAGEQLKDFHRATANCDEEYRGFTFAWHGIDFAKAEFCKLAIARIDAELERRK